MKKRTLLLKEIFFMYIGNMQHPDQNYIEAFLNNDSKLIKEIYDRFASKIKKMVVMNSGTEEDAGDIFQEALIAIFNISKKESFILTCPFEAFLYLVCKNKWISELKKRRLGVTFSDTERYNVEDVGEDSFKLAEDCVLLQLRMQLVERKLEELGEPCRKLLQLSWRRKKMNEIAAVFNYTYGYARKRKSLCMGTLLALVQKDPLFDSLKW